MPVQEPTPQTNTTDERILYNAITEAVQENAVVFRGVTTDSYLLFERKDRSQPLTESAAINLARAIAGNVRNLGTVADISAEQFLANHRGLRIA